MTGTPTAGSATVAGADGTVVVVLDDRHGRRARPVAAVAVRADGTVRVAPVVDVQRLALYAVAAAALTAAGAALTLRGRGPSIRTVHMGPGGWVSLKGTPAPPLRAAPARRPWWARLLRARRLVVE
ncbi:hypothetical protein ABZS66_49875 [Dactylosporangium sp. NPDC005572]|uniref:hypothetical protein n=1 Tax=Dactylosporangium sp. NPDC005572 TaxID=3156889 RepID=UPI0033B6CA7E